MISHVFVSFSTHRGPGNKLELIKWTILSKPVMALFLFLRSLKNGNYKIMLVHDVQQTCCIIKSTIFSLTAQCIYCLGVKEEERKEKSTPIDDILEP